MKKNVQQVKKQQMEQIITQSVNKYLILQSIHIIELQSSVRQVEIDIKIYNNVKHNLSQVKMENIQAEA